MCAFATIIIFENSHFKFIHIENVCHNAEHLFLYISILVEILTCYCYYSIVVMIK